MHAASWDLVPYVFYDIDYSLYCWRVSKEFEARPLDVEHVVIESLDERVSCLKDGFGVGGITVSP